MFSAFPFLLPSIIAASGAAHHTQFASQGFYLTANKYGASALLFIFLLSF